MKNNFISYINDLYLDYSNIIDLLRYDINKNIYYYGKHFKTPIESYNIFYKIKQYFIFYLIFFYRIYKFFITPINKNNKPNIISNAYCGNGQFSLSLILENMGYNIYFTPRGFTKLNILGNLKLFKKIFFVEKQLLFGDFKNLLSVYFRTKINDLKSELKKYYLSNNIKALFVPNDMSFFERISIDICKELNIPSFVFLHGLPGVYNKIDCSRADYMILWGDKIKENYIKTGVAPEKIFVGGHPYYGKINHKDLKFSLDNILIIGKGVNGSQNGNEVILSDRGNLILYLYSIQKILCNMGVKQVRFRPHPSENPKWYKKFIDTDFFVFDNKNLVDSIKQSSLLIGYTSSVLLESIYYGVNYVVYEPSTNNIGIDNYPLVPPFDGSDSRVPVAKNEYELITLLKGKVKVDPSFFSDYIKDNVDLSFLQDII